MMRRIALLLSLLSLTFAATAQARAPDTFEENYSPPVIIESPQWFAFELKVGPYRPAKGTSFGDAFGNDRGWLLSLELDFTVLHIPYVGQLNVGAGWGWAKYSAKALEISSGRSGEDTELKLYPLSALGVLRVDALARHTVIPLTFAGKVGYDGVRWKATTGSRTDGSGLNSGLRWGVQAAIELDFLDRSSARRLDEDFGLNHTYLLFEYFDSRTRGTGDASYMFGLGTAF